ncbi:MAG: thiamine phosphate synthase, partial [Nitrospirae bacterium]
DTVKAVLDGGVKWIQLREKELPRREIFYLAEKLRVITRQYRAVFIVNDHPDIALAVEADGVHLGQDDFPPEVARRFMGETIIGHSTHSLKEAVEAEKKGVDYIGFGPIYRTTTKADADVPKGVELLKEVTKRVSLPVVAIGGIGLERLKEVFSAGAEAVAVASDILRADNISKRAGEFVRIIEKLKKAGG